MKNFIIEVETSYGRKEHYPLSENEIAPFVYKLLDQFDGHYIIVKSKKVNTTNSYNDFDLYNVLTKIGDLEKAKNIVVNGHKCVIYFFIKLNNFEEVHIYLVRQNIFKS